MISKTRQLAENDVGWVDVSDKAGYPSFGRKVGSWVVEVYQPDGDEWYWTLVYDPGQAHKGSQSAKVAATTMVKQLIGVGDGETLWDRQV